MSYQEWTNGIYRLRLEGWPVLTQAEQGSVVDKIGLAAAKWVGQTSNWYKAVILPSSCIFLSSP